MTSRGPGLSVARAVTGGGGEMRSGRKLLAVLAIALGVALGYAVELVNRAAVAELAAGIATVSGTADLDVRGPESGFDEALYAMLASDDDVAVASPIIEARIRLRGHDEPLDALGVDVFRAAAVTPALVPSARDRLDVLRDDTLFLSAAAREWLGAREGGTVIAQTPSGDVPLRVAGTVAAPGALRYAVMDIAAMQDRFGQPGRITRIDLRLRPGVDASVAQQRLQRELPPGIAIAAPQADAAASEGLSRAYRVNLNVLALVALFTGGMLVYATQALSVARRRSQFALLRTLGLGRRRLLALVVGEAALLGITGAVAGLVAGYVIAEIALRQVGADLGAGYFHGRAVAIIVEPTPALMLGMLGIAAAIAGSALPAREAVRAAPAAALKAGDAGAEGVPVRAGWLGWIAIAIGAAATNLPAIDGLPLFGYMAIALILTGAILVMPQVAHAALRAAPRPRAAPAALALARLRATPGQVGVSLAALVTSVALMVAMAIMVASFRQSLDDWLATMLPADWYLRAGTPAQGATFTPDARRAIAHIPGIDHAEFMRTTELLVDPARPRVMLLARDLDPAHPARRLALVREAPAGGRGAPPPAWISEAFADLRRLAPGDTMTLPLAGRTVTFRVAGVWRDYARQQGAVVVERSRYAALTGDDAVNEAAIWLRPGADTAQVRDALQSGAASMRMIAATPRELRLRSLAAFDRTFAVTYALEAVAVVIGLVGLSAALSAQTLSRRREFGMLRHIGMTRRQIGGMLSVEGAAVSALGLAAGLILGFAISLILIRVVNRQSFHWGMDLHIPWAALAALSTALLILATLTAVASARKAMSEDAVRAVRDDW